MGLEAHEPGLAVNHNIYAMKREEMQLKGGHQNDQEENYLFKKYYFKNYLRYSQHRKAKGRKNYLCSVREINGLG